LELKDLKKLLQVKRRKRGLINLGGDVLNFLFGTASSTELLALHRVIEGIKKQNDVMTHSIQSQLTYTKELDENIRQNIRDVSLLARTLKTLVFGVANLNDIVRLLETNVTKHIELMANVSQTVRELEFFYLQLKQDFIKIRQGLDVTSTGKLSAGLLPPHNVTDFIKGGNFADLK
jgi:uncharacterized protein YoxC